MTRASNAAADAACPGRNVAQEGIPEPPRSPDAAYGDIIHKALAGKVPDSALTPDQLERVEACRGIERKVVVQYFGEEIQPLIREGELRATHNGFDHLGHPDVIYLLTPKALIVDYKSLASHIPEAPSNLQLRDYVVMTFGKYGHLVEQIGCALIQPLVTHSPDVCVYNARDIGRAATEMWARIAQSNDPNSPRIAGELQCKYCLAKSKCLEYQQWASQVVVPALIRFDVPMESWTSEQRSAAAAALPRAEALLEQVKLHLKACLDKDPESVPGYYLKPGAVRKTVTDPQAVFDRFTALGGSLERYMTTLSIGREKLKAEVAQATGARGQALDAAMDALLDGLTETSQAAPSLAKKKERL